MKTDLAKEIHVNVNGAHLFPKGDIRRLFVLLAAIDLLERPTVTSLSAHTSHNKGTIQADIDKLNQQFGMSIVKDGPVFSIKSWGDLLVKESIKKHFQGWII